MDLAAHLESLERSLLSPAIRHDRAQLEFLLLEDFREFGSSGRVFDRSGILALILPEETAATGATDFVCTPLGDGAALLTYISLRLATGEKTRRSSLWVHRDGRWQMLFHQGTPIPAVPSA